MLNAFSMELEAAQLHRAHCRRISDLQHHFRFGRASPRGKLALHAPLGASRTDVLLAFTGEAAVIGVCRARQSAFRSAESWPAVAVRLNGRDRRCTLCQQPARVQSSLGAASSFTALCCWSQRCRRLPRYAPAREAAQITPIEAMARGPPRISRPRPFFARI